MSTIEAPAPTTVTTADLLLRAADILEEFEWQQGHIGSREEGLCALGAIDTACHDFGLHEHQWLLFVSNSLFRHLVVWNDAAGRTKAEVVAELRRLGGDA